MALHRVRTRADQRQVALEHHVEQLRQFVEARLADDAADAGDARVVLGDELRGRGIGYVGIHRAEFVDLDQLVVEAVAPLLEQHRPAAVELDRQRDQRHQRQSENEQQAADDFVEQPFHHYVPVGDRAVEDVDHRHVADVGIGARAEAQLVGVRSETECRAAAPTASSASRRMRPSAEIGSEKMTRSTRVRRPNSTRSSTLPNLRWPARSALRAIAAAVVEQADDLDAGIFLPAQFLDHRGANIAASDNDGAAGEAAFARPFAHQQEQCAARSDQRSKPERHNRRRARRARTSARLWRRTRR